MGTLSFHSKVVYFRPIGPGLVDYAKAVLDRYRPRGHGDRKVREGPCAPAASVVLDMSPHVTVNSRKTLSDSEIDVG
jgi:hypothetical protein